MTQYQGGATGGAETLTIKFFHENAAMFFRDRTPSQSILLIAIYFLQFSLYIKKIENEIITM